MSDEQKNRTPAQVAGELYALAEELLAAMPAGMYSFSKPVKRARANLDRLRDELAAAAPERPKVLVAVDAIGVTAVYATEPLDVVVQLCAGCAGADGAGKARHPWTSHAFTPEGDPAKYDAVEVVDRDHLETIAREDFKEE